MLYGRGAVDMKDFAGMLLAIARAFRRDGIVPRRDLIFAFFADEEAGGVWGARWIVQNRPELFAGATEAISEVGGFSLPLPGDRRAYLVATAEKGVTTATLTARGHAAHGSRPTDDNAVVRLARAVVAIGEHRFPSSARRRRNGSSRSTAAPADSRSTATTSTSTCSASVSPPR